MSTEYRDIKNVWWENTRKYYMWARPGQGLVQLGVLRPAMIRADDENSMYVYSFCFNRKRQAPCSLFSCVGWADPTMQCPDHLRYNMFSDRRMMTCLLPVRNERCCVCKHCNQAFAGIGPPSFGLPKLEFIITWLIKAFLLALMWLRAQRVCSWVRWLTRCVCSITGTSC